MIALTAVSLIALVGCGGTEAQKSAAAKADMKLQIEQVCREATNALHELAMPTSQDAAVKVQRQSARILQTASAKLRELQTNAPLPAEYEAWIEAYVQLPQFNEQAAEAFGAEGLASGRAIAAGERWEAQAAKANELAGRAGLGNCGLGRKG